MKIIKKCCICESTNKVCNTEIGLLCGKHYAQYKKYGHIKTRTKYDPNEFIEEGDIIKIYLYNKDGEKIEEALIDKEDLEKVKNYKWCKDVNNYVKNSQHKYLHRIIMNEYDQYIDHINGNTLDNRKSNLRICSNADNLKNRTHLPSNNTSGIIGVRFRKDRNKWYAEIQCDKIKYNLGSYEKKEDAIKARLEAELKYFGKYKSKINEIYQTELQNSGTKDSSEKA